MTHAKVFMSGNSQAIRLPKSMQVKESELCIKKIGSSIVLYKEDNPWDSFERSLDEFPEDFLADGRNQPGMQERDGL
ncbi:MAG: type II toxin-antitoxin system VapB family antitoxin [Treponema sp.]|nr:type II toxin-antitoxin system VapB family antitoxin [Treponema sp.]